MNSIEFIPVIHSLITFVCLMVFLFKVVPAVRLDYFRDQFFEIRHDLLQLVIDCRLESNDPAYTMLRDQINMRLRHCHKFTGLLLLGPHPPEVFTEQRPTWEACLEKLDPEVRKSLLDLELRMNKATAGKVILTSPLLVALVLSIKVKPGDSKREAVNHLADEGLKGIEAAERAEEIKRSGLVGACA